MAADDCNLIFMTDDGSPLTFFIRPSETKARLRPLIEKAGGLVTSKQSANEEVIRIASDSDIVTGDGYIRAEYIEECLAKGKLLDTKDFQSVKESKKPTAEPGTSNIMESISGTGRMKYTVEEDQDILEYVAKHPGHYGGNAMWKKMELMKITNHSWQSMRDHFLKHLESRLPEYIEMERDKQKTRQSDREEEVQEMDQPPSEGANGLSELSAPTDYNHFVFNFLKGVEDPEPDLEDTEEPDGVEQQLIDEINLLCEDFSLSKKAIAMAIDLNNGDMSRTEEFLTEMTLSPDVRIWSRQDDYNLMKGDDHLSALQAKYGRKSVQERKAYLDGRENDAT